MKGKFVFTQTEEDGDFRASIGAELSNGVRIGVDGELSAQLMAAYPDSRTKCIEGLIQSLFDRLNIEYERESAKNKEQAEY